MWRGWTGLLSLLVLGASAAWAEDGGSPESGSDIGCQGGRSKMYINVEAPYRFVIDDPAVAVGVAMTRQIALECVGYGKTRMRAWEKGGKKKREWVVTVTPPPDGNEDQRVGTFTAGKFFRHVGQHTVGVGEEKVLTIPGLEVYNPGDDPEIAQFTTVGEDRLLVYGLAPGVVRLRVWTRSGERVAYAIVVGNGEYAPVARSAGGYELAGARVTVSRGGVASLPVPRGLDRFQVGNPELVEVKGARGAITLQLRGLRTGDTQLLVWDRGSRRSAHLIRVGP